MEAYGEVGVKIRLLLSSVTVRVECSAACSSRFSSGWRTRTIRWTGWAPELLLQYRDGRSLPSRVSQSLCPVHYPVSGEVMLQSRRNKQTEERRLLGCYAVWLL
jgi:hypothetical protein